MSPKRIAADWLRFIYSHCRQALPMYYHPIRPGVNVARSVLAWLLWSLLPMMAAE